MDVEDARNAGRNTARRRSHNVQGVMEDMPPATPKKAGGKRPFRGLVLTRKPSRSVATVPVSPPAVVTASACRAWAGRTSVGAAPSGALWRFSRRRATVSRYWVNIAPEIFRNNGPLAHNTAAISAKRDFYWRLVLSAKDIPHRTFRRDDGAELYVPALTAGTAVFEICAFETEKPLPPLPQPPDKSRIFGGTLTMASLFLCLLLWHIVRWHSLEIFPCLPDAPRDWLPLAGLDAYRTRASGEWWRSVTALTMHADIAHVVSNCVLGALFAFPLCRRAGVGMAFLLVILAGACGNMLTAHLRPARYMSQGFSTAVFAAAGLLAAYMAAHAFRHNYLCLRRLTATREKKRNGIAVPESWRTAVRGEALKSAFFQAMLPLGAALAFLGMLGGADAPNVDYLAHTMGLMCGIILGGIVAGLGIRLFYQEKKREAAVQAASFSLAWLLLLAAWRSALYTATGV